MNWNELQIGKYYWVRLPQTEWRERPKGSIPAYDLVTIPGKWFKEELCFYEGCGLQSFGNEEAYWQHDGIEILGEANVS